MRVAIRPEAGVALAAILPRVDTSALVFAALSGVLSGLLTAAFIAVITRGYRRLRPPRRVGYDVLSNRPIGQVSAEHAAGSGRFIDHRQDDVAASDHGQGRQANNGRGGQAYNGRECQPG